MDDRIGPRGSQNRIARLALLIGLLFIALPAAAKTTIYFEDLSLSGSVPAGATSLRVSGVPIGSARVSTNAVLDLKAIEVFAHEARITVQTAGGETTQTPPTHRYFAGEIQGRPGSLAVVRLHQQQGVHGYVIDGDSWWRIAEESDPRRGANRAVLRGLDSESGEPFNCGNGDLPDDLHGLLADVKSGQHEGALQGFESSRGAGVLYTAHIAFETDEEYLDQFGGDSAAAIDYIGDLVALGSMIYSDEVGTSWIASSINLWDTSDPWDESPGSCALYEFGKYWNDNNEAIERTIAHMLSGKSENSGVAWRGVLCSHNFSAFDISTSGCAEVPDSITGAEYGGAYGFTGGIDGNLDINNPAPIWDSFGVLHEIGHNFDSPHTHCYEDYGGTSQAIDSCYGSESSSGCYSGSTSLPSGCPGSGNGCGTIMSYCHQLGGGLSGNISLVLGEEWPYGVEPDRVPDRMALHVASRAAANPSCLALVESGEPDLVVESPGLDDATLIPSQSIELSATVRNQGSASAAATTLRYYFSSDATITTADSEVGSDDVAALGAGGTSPEQMLISGPAAAGTYWFGACADAVANESDEANNCSGGVSFGVVEECGEDCMIFSSDFEGSQ